MCNAPETVGGGVSMIWLAPLILDAFEGALSVFGIGLALVIAAIVIDARKSVNRGLSLDRTFLRIWGGLHLMLLSTFGMLGLFKPAWEIGDVSFAEVSVGGDLGRLFAGSALGVVAWVGDGDGRPLLPDVARQRPKPVWRTPQ